MGFIVAEAFLLLDVVVQFYGASMAGVTSSKVGFGVVCGSGVSVSCFKCISLVFVVVGVANSWGLCVRGIVGIR